MSFSGVPMRLLTPLLPTQVYEDSFELAAFRKVSVETKDVGGRMEVVIVMILVVFEREKPLESLIQETLGTGMPNASQEKLAICV